MEKKAYHHENLRQELIDAGGEKSSPRRASGPFPAASCGGMQCQPAAPYKHFKNKDDIFGGADAARSAAVCSEAAGRAERP